MNVKRIIVEKNILFTRMALMQDEEWIKCLIDSHFETDLQNAVVIGQVEKVVKSLKAVFVDYGADKNGILHLQQMPECYQSALHPGVRLPVQIVKQNIGEKGHKLTAKINLKGRHVICLPFEPGLFISKKIKDTEHRKALKKCLEEILPKAYGMIVRTHAEHVSLEEVKQDALEQIEKANRLMQTKDCLAKGSLLDAPQPIDRQLVFDTLSLEEPLEVCSNDENFLRTFEDLGKGYPLLTLRYLDEVDLFSDFSLKKGFETLFSKKVWLKNGGNLVIDYTEAMTVIDVNSAKAVLTHNPRKSIYALNETAVKEGILQILRRNLSGMIIMDLVDMQAKEDQEKIFEYAKKQLVLYGEQKTKVYPLTELGLLQFSRTKEHLTLPHQMLEACSVCKMPYQQKGSAYHLMQLEKQLKTRIKETAQKQFKLQLSPELYHVMESKHLKALLESGYGITLKIEKLEKGTSPLYLCQSY